MTEVPREFPLPVEAVERQRALVGGRIEAARVPARLPRRRKAPAAVLILAGALLLAPTAAIGGRLLLDLMKGPRPTPETQTPAWSPDGRMLAYVSRVDGEWELDVSGADGSDGRVVARDAAPAGSGEFFVHGASQAWSPDGRRL